MIDLLTKPAFQKRALPLSVKAWHEMIARNLVPKRAELIRGVIVEKVSKSILHVRLVARLFRLLQEQVGTGFWVRQEAPLTMADSEPEPDISIVEGSEVDYASHPSTARLVVEISVATLDEDREMAAIYAEAGVPEFWIVNARESAIEVHRQPTPAGYAHHEVIAPGDTLTCQNLPDIRIPLSGFFSDLPPLP